MALTAELIRRGATILQEPCPRCGAVQIKFKGRVYCTNEDDIRALLSTDGSNDSVPPRPVKIETDSKTGGQPSQAVQPLRKLLEEKLNALSKQLDSTTDIEEQARILDLISKYLETLEKAKRAS
jgi:UPF0148 protein